MGKGPGLREVVRAETKLETLYRQCVLQADGYEGDFDFGDLPVQDADFDFDAQDAPGPDPPDIPKLPDYEVNLTRAMYISGPHHILHNMTKSFKDACEVGMSTLRTSNT